MKTKIAVVFLVLVLFGLAASCATAPIEELYPERWEKTKIGMTLEEFKEVWPEARYAGVGVDGKTELWMVSKKGFANLEAEYFSFQNSRLLGFGETGTSSL